jgi:hypothetical protein
MRFFVRSFLIYPLCRIKPLLRFLNSSVKFKVIFLSKFNDYYFNISIIVV